jgi:heterodisulfide reductase subunit A
MGKVLVVGGGVAGMQSSLDLAEMGHQVYLLEKERELGGNLRNLYKTFPTNEKTEEILFKFTEEIKRHKEISILSESTLRKVKEKNHTFEVGIDAKGEHETFNVDAIVLATGFVPYNPTEKTEYGYSKYKDVITSTDLERIMKKGKLVRPSDSKKPNSVTFVQCVGFRDAMAYKYCSAFCCTLSVKNAILIKEEYPEIEVKIMYMDIRTPFSYENLYSHARDIGVKFIRTRPAEIFEKDNKLFINFEDTLIGETRRIETDLVVLSVGGIPPAETKELSEMMKVSLDDTGFFSINSRPSGTDSNRIFVIGAACGPKDIDYSLSQASAASAQINKFLRKTHVAS